VRAMAVFGAALTRLGLATTAIAAAAASAQIPSSRSGHSGIEYLSNEVAMGELMDFGACYAAEETRKALRLIATTPSSREEATTFVALFKSSNQGCLDGNSELSADVPLVRGAIAEGMYKKRVPIPAALMQTVPAPAEVSNLSGAARCYVGGHRAQATWLMAETRPGTRKEFDAVKRLMPDFLKCVPGDTKFSFPATVIRFRLAEALLRTAAPAAPAVAK